MGIFLSKIFIKNNNENVFPFTLPLLKKYVEIEFKTPITFILGENGSGKSTLLESLANNVGFNILGGNKNHYYDSNNNDNLNLSNNMKLSWRLKTSKGFFFRAETYFNFTEYMEEMAKENGKFVFNSYGGKSLLKQSHGESFLSLFQNNFSEGLFILDEPEAALSPERQLTLISILNDLTTNYNCQFIIATHSPLLITMKNATIYEIENDELVEKQYNETKQFQLYKNFIDCPDRYLKLLCD